MPTSRIFRRVFGTTSALLAASLAAVGWLLVQRLETRLLDQTEQDLEIKSLLVQEWAGRLSDSELQSHVQRVAREAQVRITLIRADGVVLADSDEQPERMENHANRQEIQQAQASGLGAASRFSGTVHTPMMYVARRNETGPIRFVRVAQPLDAVRAEVRGWQGVVWSAAGLTLLVGLLAGWLIARRITRPLELLSSAANSIAAGDYGKKVFLSSQDEVAELAASFNSMSEACARQVTELDRDRQQLRTILESMTEGVLVLDGQRTIRFANEATGRLLAAANSDMVGRQVWKVFRDGPLNEAVDRILTSDEPLRCDLEWNSGERRALTLQGAKLPGDSASGAVLVFHDVTHLRNLENMRKDFVANVSHELKTPLASIQAITETLLDGALHDPQHNVHFLQRIRESSDQLYRLVHDLLVLGRIESSDPQLELESIPLHQAVQRSVDRHADRATAAKVQLRTEPPAEPLSVWADEEALLTILNNLLDNAVKYTPESGTVSVRWFSEDGMAVIQVSDTGVGIPEKELPRIFERFYRVDKARSRALGGTGLGLSIVKHQAQLLRGSVSAQSQPDKGSTFTVRIPLAAP